MLARNTQLRCQVLKVNLCLFINLFLQRRGIHMQVSAIRERQGLYNVQYVDLGVLGPRHCGRLDGDLVRSHPQIGCNE